MTEPDVELSGPEDRRSDARRTHARIVRAATELILSRQALTMSALARAAEVSRPTLYDHFTSLEDVVEAAVERAVNDGEGSLRDVDTLTEEPLVALDRMLRNRWSTLARYTDLYRLASDMLPLDRLHAVHHRSDGAVETLIARGQKEGHFDTGLPAPWLVAVVYGLLHQAAEEVLAGRLSKRRAGDVLARTVLTILKSSDITPPLP